MDYRYISEEDLPVAVTLTQREIAHLVAMLEAVTAENTSGVAVGGVAQWRIRDMAADLRDIHKRACERAAGCFAVLAKEHEAKE